MLSNISAILSLIFTIMCCCSLNESKFMNALIWLVLVFVSVLLGTGKDN